MGGERLKVGKRKEKKGEEGEEARQEWTLPMAFRSLCQMPVEGGAPALGPREGHEGPASMVS